MSRARASSSAQSATASSAAAPKTAATTVSLLVAFSAPAAPVKLASPASFATVSKNPLPHFSPIPSHSCPCPPRSGLLASPSAYGMRDSNAMYEARIVRVQGVHRVDEGIEGVRKRNGRERDDQVAELGRSEGSASGVADALEFDDASAAEVELDAPADDEDAAAADTDAEDAAVDQLDPLEPWYCLFASPYHRLATLVIWTYRACGAGTGMVYVWAASCDPAWAVDEADDAAAEAEEADEARAVRLTGAAAEAVVFNATVAVAVVALDGVEGTLPAAISSTQNAPAESVVHTASLRGSRTYRASYEPRTTWFLASSSAVQLAANEPSMSRTRPSSHAGWAHRSASAECTCAGEAV